MRLPAVLALVGFSVAGCRIGERARSAADPLPEEPPRPPPRAIMTIAQLSSGAAHPRDEYGYPAVTVDRREIRRMLYTGRFDGLGRFFAERQNAFEQDLRNEALLFDAYATFATASPPLAEPLDAWVAARPADPAAHLSRAIYRQGLGWESRGGRLASDTSEEQFGAMSAHFAAAREGVAQALEREPELIVAIVEGMRMARAEGQRELLDRLLERGRRIQPASFYLLHEYLVAGLPRWGGLYREMAAFLDGPLPFAQNPRLAALRGLAEWDRGRVHGSNDRQREAVASYTRSIAAGRFAPYYGRRARAHEALGDLAAALADFESGLALEPQDADLLHRRGRTLLALGRLSDAVNALDEAEVLDPGESDFPEWRDEEAGRRVHAGWELVEAARLEEGLWEFQKALALAPDRGETFYWRGRVRLAQGDEDQALRDFRRAMDLAPRDIEAYRSADRILAGRGRWDEIIGYWNHYLALEPTSAEALLERAGTHHHKGDRERSLADLERACELGSERACALHPRGGRR